MTMANLRVGGARHLCLVLLLGAAGLLAGLPAAADEGMWTLDNLPLAQLQERYGFRPTPEWLEHVRMSCVRFNDGGSGAFVSPHGLVLTNHHVAFGQLEKMSTAEKDYVRDGFFARSPSEEMRCPDLELNQLVSLEDVTTRVLRAVKAEAPPETQNRQRKAEIARIEKESSEKTGLRSDVVELYQGAEYWLYRYRKYTDIRLVMAPEQRTAFFGGDPDNFTFPRHDLDMAFFRVYENGRPISAPHYFRWNADGAADGDLVFVLGHPGSTQRLDTVAQLEYERDCEVPGALDRLERRDRALAAYSARGAEETRRALRSVFGVQNGLKVQRGRMEALRDAGFFGRKVEEERELRSQLAGRADLAAATEGAWDRIAAAMQEMRRRHDEWSYLRSWRASRLADIAATIVDYVEEVAKPNEERYEEYRDSALESLRFKLYSPAPIYADLEVASLAALLQEGLDKLGPDHPKVRAALGGRTPQAAAEALVSGTRLADPAVRRELVRGGKKGVERSRDPLIVWARGMAPLNRELRRWHDDRVESVLFLEGKRIARARFALSGKSTYPDATFTLRLSYGRVAGYEQEGTRIPARTTFYGLFDRAAGFDEQPPFDLAPRVAAARGRLELATPLDFVTTNDIIGGNSGSPVLNRDGEYVGLIFDGNIQSLVLDYEYTEEQARAVAVHARAILEALRKIYDMGALADELTAPRGR